MEAPKKPNRLLTYAGRAAQAALFVVFNYLIFFLAPSLFFGAVGLLDPSLESTIANYFLVIGCLSVLQILLKGHMVGVASAIGLSIVQALYIYIITEGGALSISYSGLALTLEFKPLLYLMMATPLVNIVKQVYDLAHRAVMQPISMVEAE